ncbi:uncharacterized protein NECHADRAFT_82902 [Fusarium vanettenii 77-13-4]|uniref:Uncharacterized protein n=1 Tax=Fusarium vanettenii (strain ATCC MYA-4622 / CBS 123669 / FGSC 9596 / NRRL 45880 / 77-13-4) TaxID=660122 RepID=C7YX59_FUSV7|nr:uncharacterized protein NECHADRAFT_82902 [Fusarium vanettenii 77-13-4]EEU43774.1 predicted protein [Fusarium vanettenii 77-13-4]
MAVVTVINSEEDAVEESVIDTVAGVLTDSVADRVVDSVEETSVLTVLDSVEDSEASVYVSEAEVSVVKEEIVALNVAVELETVKLSVELDWGLHGLAFDPDSIKTAIQAVTNAWETIGSVKEFFLVSGTSDLNIFRTCIALTKPTKRGSPRNDLRGTIQPADSATAVTKDDFPDKNQNHSA